MSNASQSGGLPGPKDAHELLELYFLEIRSNLLEAAAGFDRIERAGNGEEAMKDPRVVALLKNAREMMQPGANRTQRFLETLSEPG